MIRKKTSSSSGVKAVAPVVGFLLVVAIIFLAAGQYQANVVPEQERQSEANHFQEVKNDMNQVRTEIIRASGSGQRQTQQFQTGLNYGVIGLNQPPVPGVFLHLDTENDIEIRNAENNQAAESFWDGDRIRSYETGIIGYRVDYNRFAGAGELYVEHGFMYQDTVPGITPRDYKEDPDTGPLRVVEESDQPIFDGRTITLYTVKDGLTDNDLTASGISSTTVELIPSSPRAGGSMNSITVTDQDASEPIKIALPTRLPESEWESILDQEYDPSDSSDEGYVQEVNSPDDVPYLNDDASAVEFVLETGEIYNLRMSRVNIQTLNQRSPTVEPEPKYVAVENPVANVREESTVLLEAEARDKYNNGVIGQEVEAEARRDDTGECIGSFQQSDGTPQCTGGSQSNQPGLDVSNEHGFVDYRYQAPEVPDDTSISFIYRLRDN